jgi:benzoyl-CoA reductase/2-hydroxyglutaryl-CoA dehydratase subunit BcrC/BadD/HgdB
MERTMENSEKQAASVERTSARHSLEAAKKVRKLVKESYTRAHEAITEGRPVAWYMVCYINPIFMAMDIVPVMPENWAALCATKRMEGPYILRAESEGYANQVCSYSRIGMGYCSMLREGDLPLDVPDGGLAKPSMLIGSSAFCDIRYKYFQSIARYMDAPYYCFDNLLFPPFDTIGREDVRKQYIKYQVEQYKGLIEFMEKVTERHMDWDRLSHYIDIAIET